MKVLWITGNFYPIIGGLEVYTELLTRALAKQCHVGLIIESGQHPPINNEIRSFSVDCIRHPTTEQAFVSTKKHIEEIVLTYGPDVVHFSNAGVAVYKASVAQSIPTFATVHGNDLTAPWQLVPHGTAKDAVIEALNSVSHIITVSEYTEGLIKRSAIATQTSVIRHGCDLQCFRPFQFDALSIKRQFSIPTNCPILLTVGRFVPRKGHMVLLKAICKLSIPFHWIVVGEGPLFPEFVEELRRRGMASRTTLLRRVSERDLSVLYNLCNLFVLVPLDIVSNRGLDSEGFGMVFQEAGACGKPVIGSDVSGCREAVVNGETGILVPAGDCDRLTQAITAVITDDSLARSLGDNGLIHARALGDWSRVADDTYSLYTRAIGCHGT